MALVHSLLITCTYGFGEDDGIFMVEINCHIYTTTKSVLLWLLLKVCMELQRKYHIIFISDESPTGKHISDISFKGRFSRVAFICPVVTLVQKKQCKGYILFIIKKLSTITDISIAMNFSLEYLFKCNNNTFKIMYQLRP